MWVIGETSDAYCVRSWVAWHCALGKAGVPVGLTNSQHAISVRVLTVTEKNGRSQLWGGGEMHYKKFASCRPTGTVPDLVGVYMMTA